jgi:hypothetical protein
MEIVERIVQDFINQYMITPKTLYLGQKQFDELRLLAERISTFQLQAFPKSEISRAEYKGMKIYLVDSDDYVACGF